MRRAGFFAAVCLAALLYGWGAMPAAFAASSAAQSIACNGNTATYMLDVPTGWGNLPETASELEICAMLSPGLSDFYEAPALIYMRVAEKESGADTVEEFMTKGYKRFLAAPGGDGAKLSRGGKVFSDAGVDFEMHYLDNGPKNNEFELIACHAGKDSIFVVVLNSGSPENRLKHMPDFMKALKSVKAYEVMGKVGN